MFRLVAKYCRRIAQDNVKAPNGLNTKSAKVTQNAGPPMFTT